MRHVKIYEDFSDEDIKGLIDDLSKVGQADKFRVICNTFIMVPEKEKHPYEWSEWAFRNIEVEVSCREVRSFILEEAFEKVLKGEFEQVTSDPNLDLMFKSAPELVPVLSKDHMIQLAKKANSMSRQHDEGKLYTLQAKLLVPEIEDLMYNRLPDLQDLGALKHLDENIGYNIIIRNK
jgi:hypothetical protein